METMAEEYEEDGKIHYAHGVVEKRIYDLLSANPQGMTLKEIEKALPEESENIIIGSVLICMGNNDLIGVNRARRNQKYFAVPQKKQLIIAPQTITVQS